jgi:hypothetical protein
VSSCTTARCLSHHQALLSAQPDTRETLADLALQKHVFTNADAKHTAACLSRMGLTDCFQVRRVRWWLFSALVCTPWSGLIVLQLTIGLRS